LIGARTGKLLYVGTRNKYCCICAAAKKKGIEVPNHKCYKNYEGTSTGMEQEMIVEAFCTSVELYDLKYLYYVGDGDSSVFARIREKCPYGRQVKKKSCRNHCIRAFTSGLYGVALNSVLKHPALRKYLRNNIPRMIKAVNIAVSWSTEAEKNGSMPKADRVKMFQNRLKNVPYHVFGEHEKCDDGCKKKGDKNEYNYVPDFKQTDIWQEIEKKLYGLVSNAENLRSDITTNNAECFMSMNSRHQSSKSVFRAKRNGYTIRTRMAGLKKDRGNRWAYYCYKNIYGKSPCKAFKKNVSERESRKIKAKAALFLRKKYNPACRQKNKTSAAAVALPDFDYGPDAATPDIEDGEMETRKEEIITVLASEVDTSKKRADMTKNTKEQFASEEFINLKDNRLTASNFGPVYTLKDFTHPHNTVKRLRDPTDLSRNPAIQHGKVGEERVIKEYENDNELKVKKSGIFVNEQWCYLGATPDGLIGDDGIVEVKCLYSARDVACLFDYVAEHQGVDQQGKAIDVGGGKKKKKSAKFSSLCLEIFDGKLRLKRNFKYYHQVQGQLAISNRKYCIFIAATNLDKFVEKIYPDAELWDKMLPKLKRFYHECLLPEIIDPRISRGMKVRDPAYFTAALSEKERKKKKK